MHFETIEEAFSYLDKMPSFTKKTPLGNTRVLMDRLGLFGMRLKIIHVAGTNGKGSVCAYLDGILRKAGLQTGVFTSPHLVRVTERFSYNGEEIGEEEFLFFMNTVMAAVSDIMREGALHPAYFELLFVMFLLWMKEKNPDYCILEAGMGGRGDVTVLAEKPVLCVITSISLDHTAYLGNTISKIAFQKGGIIRPGVPVVYDAISREARLVITQEAAAKESPAEPVGPEMARVIRHSDKGIDFVLDNKYYDNICVHLSSPALYQVQNCSLAMTAAAMLNPDGRMPELEIADAAGGVVWEGRMEMAADRVLVDGAHNEDGIRRFLETAAVLAGKNRLSLLFAVSSDKDYAAMVRALCEKRLFGHITVTQIKGYRKTDCHEIAALFRTYTDVPVACREHAAEALSYARERLEDDELLLCAGSLYLIGEIRAQTDKEGKYL